MRFLLDTSSTEWLKQWRIGWITLMAVLLSVCLAIAFKYLTLQPQPVDIPLLISPLTSATYPSGVTAAALAVTTVIILAYRQLVWSIIALVGATVMALSRIYVGQHDPSNILGGVPLGVAVGAVSYGLILPQRPWRERLGWLLWLQIAIALIVTQMAYLNILPGYFLSWPLSDKVLHFLLIGSIAFWLNLWLNGRTLQMGRWSLPLALLIPFSLALLEEGIQFFSPVRTADIIDLSSDLLGLLFFWWLSQRIVESSQEHQKLVNRSKGPR